MPTDKTMDLNFPLIINAHIRKREISENQEYISHSWLEFASNIVFYT